MKKIIFLVLISIANILYAVLPPTPTPPLPIPDRYTPANISNNAFVYPDSIRVTISTAGPLPVSITSPVIFNVSGSTVNAVVSGVTGSTVAISNPSITQYDNKVSSGIAGKITGMTSATLTVTAPKKVVSWAFKHLNTGAPDSEVTVESTLLGQKIYLYDGDSDSEDNIKTPVPTTFNITLPVSSTVQYRIMTIQ